MPSEPLFGLKGFFTAKASMIQHNQLCVNLNSGYTLHLDLQNLNIENRQKVWNELVKINPLKRNHTTHFITDNHSDQFAYCTKSTIYLG